MKNTVKQQQYQEVINGLKKVEQTGKTRQDRTNARAIRRVVEQRMAAVI